VTVSDKATSNFEKLEKLKMKEREIAVRGFMNEKFGTTYGKGLFHRAIYNGSVEIRSPYAKYLIDLFEYSRWESSAKSDDQLTWVDKMRNARIDSTDSVVSWVQHYDPMSKTKQSIDGVCVYLSETQELHISINDPDHDVVDTWTLDVKSCAKLGTNKPVFIATNVDLNSFN
jgi:hypothetical protein